MRHFFILSGIFIAAMLLFGCTGNQNPPAVPPNASNNVSPGNDSAPAQPEAPLDNASVSGCPEPAPAIECSADNSSVISYVCQDNAWKPNAVMCAAGCSKGKCLPEVLPEAETCPTDWIGPEFSCSNYTTTTYDVQSGSHNSVFYNVPENPQGVDLYVAGVGEDGVRIEFRHSGDKVSALGTIAVCEALYNGPIVVRVLDADAKKLTAKIEVLVCQ
jgi:hypothetical protein